MSNRADDFVRVNRELLKLGRGKRGWRFDAAVLTYVEYIHHYGRRTVRVAELAARAGVHYSTALRSLARLRKRGWLCHDNRRNWDQAQPPNPKNTFVHVTWAQLRELGAEDAYTEAQLEAMPPTAQLEDGRMCAPPALLSTLLGQHPDTSRASVRRLAFGDTLRVRQRERGGDKSARVSRLRLEHGWGGAPAFVLRTDRERERLRKRLEAARELTHQQQQERARAQLEDAMQKAGVVPPPRLASAPSTRVASSGDTMPSLESLAQIIAQNKATAPPVQDILRVLMRKPTH